MAKEAAVPGTEATCRTCGATVPAEGKFCSDCGSPVAPSTGIQIESPPAWKSALTMMFNPALVLKNTLGGVAPQFALAVSGVAFALFFLQTGLDLGRTGSASLPQIAILAALGAVYGSVGIAVLSVAAWVLSLPFRSKRSIGWTLRAFALGYSPALVYALVGIGFNVVLGWNTAVIFGVTGVLWAMGPMLATLKEMTGGRTGPSVVLATICGGLVLFGWSLLGTRSLAEILSIVNLRV